MAPTDMPGLEFPILTGMSVGAINTIYLAAHTGPLPAARCRRRLAERMGPPPERRGLPCALDPTRPLGIALGVAGRYPAAARSPGGARPDPLAAPARGPDAVAGCSRHSRPYRPPTA